MADNDNWPPWHAKWHEALERVVVAAVDATQPGTLEREAAGREHFEALAIFREVANRSQ